MKVLHIASGDLWAGAEKALYTLAVAQQQSGQIHVTAAILNPGALAEQLRAAGVEVLVLNESHQTTLQLIKFVRKWARDIQPDIIHTHRLKENIIGGLVAVKLGIPSVRTQHGANEHAFRWFNLRKRLIHDLDFLTGRFLQKKIIAVSRPLGAELSKSFGPAKTAVIDNGIDIGEAECNLQHKFQPPLVIGIVGRLVPLKRVDLFLRVAQRVLSTQCAEGAPVFEVIGDGPLRNELRQLAVDLGIDKRVKFIGHVDNAEPFIGALDVLVICSDHEGLPMVALEAMKHHTLIVTHQIGGLPDLLGQGQFGHVLDSQRIEKFVEVLDDIIQQPKSAAQKAAMARQQLQNHYSSEAMAQQYLAVYRQVLATG